MTPDTLGGRIRAARKERGWSLRDLDARCGVSNAELSNLETGKQTSPRLKTMLGLARAFDMSLDELATGQRLAGPADAVAECHHLRARLAAVEALLAQALDALKE